MTTEQWLGVALICTALAVALLAVAGFMLGAVLSRVADALEGLRPPPRGKAVQPRNPLADRIDLQNVRRVWPPI